MNSARRFRVRKVIGRGGHGNVYLADALGEHDVTKAVALKLLHFGQDATPEIRDDLRRRLRDEARILALVRHRAIVHVEGLVWLGDAWAVALEYVDGADLNAILSRPIPVGCALEIVAEAAAALHVAYTTPTSAGTRLNLVHRDIKPSNLQITAAGEIKVLDFGVARAEFATREAKSGELMFGTLNYMSPERLKGTDSHASDVYALGCVLYEALAHELFEGASSIEARHTAALAAGTRRLRAQVTDPAIVGLVQACLDYDPAKRPTAHDLDRRLRALRTRYPEPAFAEWSEKAVAAARRDQPLADDALVGTVLTEAELTDAAFEPVPLAVPPTPEPVPVDRPDTAWERRPSSSASAATEAITRPPETEVMRRELEPERAVVAAIGLGSGAALIGVMVLTMAFVVGAVVFSVLRVEPSGRPVDAPVAPPAAGVATWVAGQTDAIAECASETGGQVTLAWTISGGHARSVQSSANSTGNPASAACIEAVVGRGVFDPTWDGPTSYVFDVPPQVHAARPNKPSPKPVGPPIELLLQSRPPLAKVFIDGALVGTTPLRRTVVPGPHLFRFEYDGAPFEGEALLSAEDAGATLIHDRAAKKLFLVP